MSVIEYSSKLVADPGERRQRWQAITGRSNMVLFDDGFDAEIRGGDLGPARICSVSHGRQQISNERGAIRASTRPLFKFVFQEEGECRFEQTGRTITLRAGEWCLYEKTRPHYIFTEGFSRQTALLLPFATGDVSRWESHLMCSYPTFEGAGHILHDSVIASVTEIARLSEASRYLMGKALANLAELTLLDKTGGRECVSSRDALRAKVNEHIQKNLGDPDLDIDSIAIAMGCSKRYLHKVFSDQGATIAKLIWNARLERCYIDLSDPTLADRKITDIAYSWGFCDSHHFSRMFKARYGVTPGCFRKSGPLR
jgi:AraC family transcriptional regulator, positive regulator of tynA and feaB